MVDVNHMNVRSRLHPGHLNSKRNPYFSVLNVHLKTLKSATCLLVGNPTPPVAPINQMIGLGTGRYNGADGYTVSFTLIDNGEPGRRDMLAFLIYETANPSNVVLSLPLQLLTKGNLQAHLDQR